MIGRLLGIEGCVGHGAELPDDRVGGCDSRRPGRLTSQGGDLLLGRMHDLSEGRLHDRLAVPLRQERLEPLLHVAWEGVSVGIDGRPPFVEDQSADVGGQRCRAERAEPPVGVPIDVHRGSRGLGGRVHHGRDVLELPRQRVVPAVTAAAAATSVHRVDGGVRLQEGQDGPPAGVVGDGTVYDHKRWSCAAAPVGDLRPVGGRHVCRWIPCSCPRGRLSDACRFRGHPSSAHRARLLVSMAAPCSSDRAAGASIVRCIGAGGVLTRASGRDCGGTLLRVTAADVARLAWFRTPGRGV